MAPRLVLGLFRHPPTPGSPLGRTVVATFGTEASGGRRREFRGTREYTVHLGALSSMSKAWRSSSRTVV